MFLLSGWDRLEFVDNKWTSNLDGVHPFSVPIKTELKEVGQDEIWERVTVAFQLIRTFDVLELFLGEVLGLDVTDDVLFAVPDAEVGVSGFGFLRKGGDVDACLTLGLSKGLDELFQVGIEALFAGVTTFGGIKDLLKILS